MILMDLYKRGIGIIEKFAPINNESEAKEFISNYCKEHNVSVVAIEKCGDARWNYLSDGSEIDYCWE